MLEYTDTIEFSDFNEEEVTSSDIEVEIEKEEVPTNFN